MALSRGLALALGDGHLPGRALRSVCLCRVRNALWICRRQRAAARVDWRSHDRAVVLRHHRHGRGHRPDGGRAPVREGRMSVYTDDQERDIRVARLVKDWASSGLLSGEQRDRILPELKVDLRRTNLFLRGTLFLFTLLIVQSTIGLVMIAVGTTGDEVIAAVLLVIGSAANFWVANILVRRFHLYRF